jgi:hypothetical protein
MEQVIKLVKTYRLIEPDLRFFVFSAIQPPAAGC